MRKHVDISIIIDGAASVSTDAGATAATDTTLDGTTEDDGGAAGRASLLDNQACAGQFMRALAALVAGNRVWCQEVNMSAVMPAVESVIMDKTAKPRAQEAAMLLLGVLAAAVPDINSRVHKSVVFPVLVRSAVMFSVNASLAAAAVFALTLLGATRPADMASGMDTARCISDFCAKVRADRCCRRCCCCRC